MEERFEVLTAVLLRVQIVWDVMLCYWVSSLDCFVCGLKSQLAQEE